MAQKPSHFQYKNLLGLCFATLLAITLLPIDDSEAARRKRAKKPTYYVPPSSALLVNADTGEVLYAKDADGIRFPASLTKMMTLYMTFEALKSGKLKLDQQLPISRHAASQQQTNISLTPGDTISVRKCIESLVIRSANDSAMVLAEAMGTSEWNFGLMMTEKARVLGMKNTVFKNPAGLPNAAQHTTARDMAILGIALRKHYPQYYPYFSLRSFTYNGRVYKTHNRVLDRFNGADGIKTGFTNASGFNLVTSVKRDGYNIVGVVMGGKTWKSRDDQMVQLLTTTFTSLTGKKPAIQDATNKKDEVAITKARLMDAPDISTTSNAVADGQAGTLASAGEDYKPTNPKHVWGIQVGAFLTANDATSSINQAISTAALELKNSIISAGKENTVPRTIHRAQLMDLTEEQARTACKKLLSKGSACFVYRSDKKENS